MPKSLPHISAIEIAGLVRSRELRATEVVERTLALIDERDQDVRSVVWRDDEQALRTAAQLDTRADDGSPLPPLAGVPITVKDVLNVAGQPNTQSSLAFDADPVTESDMIVEVAQDAGLVQVGRSASPEVAMTTSCESDRWGITHNPWSLEHSPGGSSGGAAANVAAGLVPVALAGDGGGSIRVPAAFCGVVGLKPSRGLLPTRVQGWAGGAVDGVITRTIADTAFAYTHLATPDSYAWTRNPAPQPDYLAALAEPTRPLRIGLLTDGFDPTIPVDPACVAAAEDVAARLSTAGHQITPVRPVPAMAEVMDIYPRTIIPTWLALQEVPRPELLPAHVQRHIAHGTKIPATTYVNEVLAFQQLAREILQHMFADVDVVLTPTTATRVPRIGAVRSELLESGGPTSRTCTLYEQTLAFTTVPSVIGSPALQLPTHMDDDGLPLGVQLIGEAFSEAVLLQLGRDLEAELRWTERAPQLTSSH